MELLILRQIIVFIGLVEKRGWTIAYGNLLYDSAPLQRKWLKTGKL